MWTKNGCKACIGGAMMCDQPHMIPAPAMPLPDIYGTKYGEFQFHYLNGYYTFMQVVIFLPKACRCGHHQTEG